MSSTDAITRTVIIKAPRSRVWKAVSDAKQFGAWFGVRIDGVFSPGRASSGRMTIKGFEHYDFTIDIDRVEPETLFSYAWHPYAIDLEKDYSHEKKTLVTFRLSDVPEGTKVEITESGFDALPKDRYDEAYRSNTGGWAHQAENVRNYVESHAS